MISKFSSWIYEPVPPPKVSPPIFVNFSGDPIKFRLICSKNSYWLFFYATYWLWLSYSTVVRLPYKLILLLIQEIIWINIAHFKGFVSRPRTWEDWVDNNQDCPIHPFGVHNWTVLTRIQVLMAIIYSHSHINNSCGHLDFYGLIERIEHR